MIWSLLKVLLFIGIVATLTLGAGILLDTFLVRTVTVPAMASLVGRANWWPSQRAQGSIGT